MMKMEELIETKKSEKGTYAGIRFSSDTKKTIIKYLKENNIPNPLPSTKLHSTLLYSRNYLPDYEPYGKLDETWIGKPTHFSIFTSNPNAFKDDTTNCLVLEYSCPKQTARFDKLMEEHDATFDFDEYKPHITLSYDVGDLKIKDLPDFKGKIEIVEEYGEDLNLNWAEDEGIDK